MRKKLKTVIYETEYQRFERLEKEFHAIEMGRSTHTEFRAAWEEKLDELEEESAEALPPLADALEFDDGTGRNKYDKSHPMRRFHRPLLVRFKKSSRWSLGGFGTFYPHGLPPPQTQLRDTALARQTGQGQPGSNILFSLVYTFA